MASRTLFSLHHPIPIIAHNGGLFISRGKGTHPTRTIDSHELIIVRSGRLAMFEGTRQFDLGRGDCLLLWPGRRHGGVSPYPPDLSFFWVHFAAPAPGPGPLPGPSRPPSRRRGRLSSPIGQIVRLRHECQSVFELMVRFLDDQQRTRDAAGAKRSVLLTLILMELAEAHRHRDELSPRATDGALLASRARELIATVALEPQIRTAAVARKLQCNADYLARTFRAVFGHSLTHEIHTVRIMRARRLLAESRLGIKQVARECGFGDIAFFREVFRRHTGSSPAAFRRVRSAIHVNTV